MPKPLPIALVNSHHTLHRDPAHVALYHQSLRRIIADSVYMSSCYYFEIHSRSFGRRAKHFGGYSPFFPCSFSAFSASFGVLIGTLH